MSPKADAIVSYFGNLFGTSSLADPVFSCSHADYNLTYSRRAVAQGRFCRALEETWIWRDIESRRAQNEEALLKSVMILKNSMNK